MNEKYLPNWDSEKAIKLVERKGTVSVVVNNHEYMSWATGDEEAQRMAIVQMHRCGLGSQEQLAKAFNVHVNSVKNYIRKFSREGAVGIVTQRRGPRGSWKLTPKLRSKILTVVIGEGVFELEAVQTRLGEVWHEEVSLPSIRQVLVENGFFNEFEVDSDPAVQEELFDVEDAEQFDLVFDDKVFGEVKHSSSVSKDVEGDKEESMQSEQIEIEPVKDRKSRREYSPTQRTYLDLLEQGDYNAYAGALLFAPLLNKYNYLSTLKRVIDVPAHSGYSLEELCLTLFHYDVYGFNSMEDFKRAYSEEFGVLIGRLQSPSIFTLRRFLHKVRKLGKGEELIDEFALSYLKYGLANWGVMYIDGHFLPYHGIYAITKGWHGVRQIPMKGSYNFLVVDEEFCPWLFLVRSSSEDLLQKIPELIEKAKKIGLASGIEKGSLDNLIVLFDREGYSAELYRQLEGKDQGEGCHRAIFVSWAKYASKWVYDINEGNFDKTVVVAYEIRKPEEVRYFETNRTMNKYGKIRTIVIQTGRDKRRAAIYTNAKTEQINSERIVQLMCRRWGEENRIKDLLTKHRINYMPGYVVEEMEVQPLINNPNVKEFKKKRGVLLSDLRKYKVQLADEVLATEQKKKIKSPKTPIREDILRLENEILLLNHQLDQLPEKVRYDEAHDGRRLLELNYEKKRFLDCIKVFTCNIKAEMCRMLSAHYDRPKEIQPALSMIVGRAGHVKLEGGELRVKLRKFKNSEINYAARHLCEDLNEMCPETTDRFHFPIRYSVQ